MVLFLRLLYKANAYYHRMLYHRFNVLIPLAFVIKIHRCDVEGAASGLPAPKPRRSVSIDMSGFMRARGDDGDGKGVLGDGLPASTSDDSEHNGLGSRHKARYDKYEGEEDDDAPLETPRSTAESVDFMPPTPRTSVTNMSLDGMFATDLGFEKLSPMVLANYSTCQLHQDSQHMDRNRGMDRDSEAFPGVIRAGVSNVALLLNQDTFDLSSLAQGERGALR